MRVPVSLPDVFMYLRDAVPECLRPDSEGLESARSVSKTGSGRESIFAALLWRHISLPRCQRVLATCAPGQSTTAEISEEDLDQQGDEKAVRGA